MEVDTLLAKRLNRSTATSQDWVQQPNTCMQQVHAVLLNFMKDSSISCV
jgi:hypothetical protein